MFGAAMFVCEGVRRARLLNNMNVHELAEYCESHGISLVIEDGMIAEFEPCSLCREGGAANA